MHSLFLHIKELLHRYETTKLYVISFVTTVQTCDECNLQYICNSLLMHIPSVLMKVNSDFWMLPIVILLNSMAHIGTYKASNLQSILIKD